MSRVDLLLALYRLSMCVPEDMNFEHLRCWLDQRQALIDALERAPADPASASLQGALAALVVHADQPTYDQLVKWKRQLGVTARRMRCYG